MSRAGRRAGLAVALALAVAGGFAREAAAQPWARFAVSDSALGAALKAGAAGYEAAWNALLIAELRARLARADSATALERLAVRIARAEPAALGGRIGLDALALRTVWSRTEWRVRIEAAVAESLGNAAETARQVARADSLYREALARYRALGDRRRSAWVMGSRGRNAFAAGDVMGADSLHRAALAARRGLGDPRMLGASLNALGSVSWSRGLYPEARDFYREARAVRLETGERAALSQTLNFLGLAWRSLGEPDSARRSFDEALAITTALGDSLRTLDVLLNLSDFLSRSGDLASIAAVERRALAITSARGLADREVGVRGNATRGYVRFGHYTDARRTAEAATHVSGASPGQQLNAWNELGLVHLRLADARAARAPLERALALADSIGDPGGRARALNHLAIAARLDGDAAGGAELARRALEGATAAGDSAGVQASLVTLGEIARERGEGALAARRFERAAAISATLGPQVHAADLLNEGASLVAIDPARAAARFEQARGIAAAAGAPVEHSFALLGLGEVAERRGDWALALERARAAAALMDTTRARQGSGGESITLASRWRFAFDALIHLLMKLDAQQPGRGHAAEAFHWAERARARALLDLVAGGAGQPFTLDQARAALAPDALLLEYAVGDSSTTLWAVTSEGAGHYTLPGRAALLPRIEILRRGLADPERALSRPTLAAAHALYRELIASALAAHPKARRLIVSPDGPLALIPFEALLAEAPRAGKPPRADDWLGARADIAYAFSAATLAARSGAGGGRGIVAVANPDFGGAQPPLPYTADERAALERLAGARHVAFAALAGAAATRARLLALPELPGAALLHVATHGVANEVEPEQSGLWLAVDSTGGAPGFLSVADVAGLELRADLVTLSACETGLGRLERGEGVVGLTRAFVAAGARSVVVSLWRVNDRSSSQLMERFYRELIAKRRPRDRALAEARRALMRSDATRSPFHWAAFVLVGETGPIAP